MNQNSIDSNRFQSPTCKHGFFISEGEPCPEGCVTENVVQVNQPEGQFFTGKNYFHLDIDLDPIWGDGDSILWAAGEPLYICAATGVGKTTMALQLAEARAGVRESFLDFPMRPTESRILYIAADRAAQFGRLYKNMIHEDSLEQLDAVLTVCHGYPKDFLRPTTDPDFFLALAEAVGPIDTVIVDSAKDFAPNLASEEGGSAFNTACQRAVSDGIQVAVLHHERKAQSGVGVGVEPTLDGIYGSMALTAGAGSVLSLVRRDVDDPLDGRLYTRMYQVKSAAGQVGAVDLITYHPGARTRIDEIDITDVLRPLRSPISIYDLLARQTGRSEGWTNSEIQRMRRRVKKLCDENKLTAEPATVNGKSGFKYTLTTK